jgi:hypothetical protein
VLIPSTALVGSLTSIFILVICFHPRSSPIT